MDDKKNAIIIGTITILFISFLVFIVYFMTIKNVEKRSSNIYDDFNINGSEYVCSISQRNTPGQIQFIVSRKKGYIFENNSFIGEDKIFNMNYCKKYK